MDSNSQTPGLTLTSEGNFAWLTLDRPEKRNALSQAMWQGLPGLIARFEGGSAKVLIVRGAGGHFAAGADISEFESVYATRASTQAYFSAVAAGMSALATCAKPTLAQIEGACVGGGLGLALCCDLRLAAEGARLGITPGKLGLMYSLDDTRRLVEAVGPQLAKDILYTGRILEASEALDRGLILSLHAPTELEAAVLAKAGAIAQASQWSARKSKSIIGKILDGQSGDDATTAGWMLDAVALEDFAEGRAAFLEKRAPNFPFR